MRRHVFIYLLLALVVGIQASERKKLNFNADWRLYIGDEPKAVETFFDDSCWQQVTLPYAFNGDEAFRKDIVEVAEPAAGELDLFKAKNGGNTKMNSVS
jgi:hypothetical protein